MRVASLVSGIFFKAKIANAVDRVGTNTFCNTLDEVHAASPDVVLVDLEHPDSHLVLAAFGSQSIAFGPHLRTDLLAVAQKFGARTYPRSAFFNDLDKLLHQHE